MPRPVPANQAPAAASDNPGIVPSLAELLAMRSLAQDRGRARRGWHGQTGQAASPLRGRGMEYAESREYDAGDDVRHVDWRLTARTGRTHTKLFQAERDRLSLIVADTAPALYFGTRQRFKSVQAARAGAMAAWRAVADGDRIAALRGSRREAPVPPAAGSRGALRVLHALQGWYSAVPQDDAGLDHALEHALRLLRPGSRLLVLADASSIESVADRRWAALAMHNQVNVLLLTDPLEQDPPPRRLPMLAAGDAAPRRIDVDLADAGHRRRWAQRFSEPLQQASQRLSRLRIDVQVLSTDEPTESWLPGREAQPA